MKRLLLKLAYWIFQKYGHMQKADLKSKMYFQGMIFEIETVSLTASICGPTELTTVAKEIFYENLRSI